MRTALIQELELDELINESASEAVKLALPDPDEREWMMIGSDGRASDIKGADLDSLRSQAQLLYYKDATVRNIIKNLIKFTIGSGGKVKVEPTGNTDLDNKIGAAWDRFIKANKFRRKQIEVGRRVFVDGESFLQYTPWPEKNTLLMSFIEPDHVRSKDHDITHGIETEANIVTRIKSYRVMKKATDTETVLSPDEVQHIKSIDVDENVKRGRTILEPALQALKYHKNFLRSRITLATQRSNLLLVRKSSGTASEIQANINNLASTQLSGSRGTNREKAIRPGTVVDTNQFVDYEFKHPQLGSGEASIDGRMMLLEVSRAVGMPEFIVTADASNNNFASLKEALIVAIKETEMWQEFFKEEYCEIFDRVIRYEMSTGGIVIPDNINIICDFEFDVFDLRDILKEAQAMNLLIANGLISKSTAAANFGYNYKKELEQINQDMEMENRFDFNPNPDDEEDV